MKNGPATRNATAEASGQTQSRCPTKLRICWRTAGNDQPSNRFAMAVASLLSNYSEAICVKDTEGRESDDLDLDECVTLVQESRAVQLTFEFGPEHSELGERWVVYLRGADDGGQHESSIEMHFHGKRQDRTFPASRRTFSDLAWLQSHAHFKSPLLVLALPLTSTELAPDALHGFVGLASKCGDFVSASAQIADRNGATTELAQWHRERPVGSNGRVTRPVVGLNSDTLWLPNETVETDSKATLWLDWPETDETKAAEGLSGEKLRSAVAVILEQKPIDFAILTSKLQELVPEARDVRFVSLRDLPLPQFMSHPQKGIVGVVSPDKSVVRIGLDADQDSAVLVDTVLHSLGHVLLGHIRIGDEYGHWDTVETVRASGTARRWDRKVNAAFGDWFQGRGKRIVHSLDECTPHEKACLGLWRMIGETLGKSRRLHYQADRYQPAAYQRLAAQRLLAQLVDYDGAMLCDGVGLGKTYVATTLLVHFANEWRDRFKDNPDALVGDPFRITILAPNSVVSTWRREALPPLGAYGVPLSTTRVVSHTKLSRISASSEVLRRASGTDVSDLEHLLLSDLVIVDEAHNFRSLSATRTKVLRDLLRLQPRKEQRRRVLLLTATPINNSLEDLRQEVSLLFSRPIWLSDAKTDVAYRRQAVQEIAKRCEKARESSRSRSDVCALVIHGHPEAKFSDAVDFRDDLDFGTNVQRIGAYLKEQDKKLKNLQDEIRASSQIPAEEQTPRNPVRIADELLDRIVVQRSRALCKEIEKQQGTNVELLFRPDAGVPEKLYYSDEYDGIKDVLASFLPLFESDADQHGRETPPSARALSLKVYMWYDVQEGIKHSDETSSVVGLQRVLVLKRLESSPVSFLITLLRLTVLHAYRLEQLRKLCRDAGNASLLAQLAGELNKLLAAVDRTSLDKIRTLAVGDRVRDPSDEFLKRLSDAHGARPAAASDDSPSQFSLFEKDEEVALENETQLQRLWPLREWLLRDLETLLCVTPRLADIVFGKFNRREWPHNFIAGGEQIDWPPSGTWGMRVVTDPKVRKLVSRLLQARRTNQKVIVFSQFSDTLAYVQSVLRACREFTHQEWDAVVAALGVRGANANEIQRLIEVSRVITGDTEDRDLVVNAFAPYYRIGPEPPATDGDTPLERQQLIAEWEAEWRNALYEPVDVLLSTDVLAEGVNLQDAAVLINFDVHWNPVRMIQRAGRIDRRLNPKIEKNTRFESLAALAKDLGHSVPTYYWHGKGQDSPLTVNMILPDELEAELLLRERIATKTLAIDFTLGLEQGTGAEADWMKNYKYQGVSSLNAFQKDRAIEQIASFHEKFNRIFNERRIATKWVLDLNGWYRINAKSDAPLVARVAVRPYGTDETVFTRYLTPHVIAGVPHWLWSEDRSNNSVLNFWMAIDGKTEPPVPTQRGIAWHDDASRPVRPDDLLKMSVLLDVGGEPVDEREPDACFCELQQGVAAVTAGRYSSDEDREELAGAISHFFVLQFPIAADTQAS